MSSLWDDLTRAVRDGVDVIVEKTEKYSKVGKLKVDILNMKRNIDRNFSELGGRVYHLIAEEKNTQVVGNKAVDALIEKIKKMEKALADKNAELKKVQSEKPSESKAKSPAKKASPSKAKSKTGSTKKSTASTSASSGKNSSKTSTAAKKSTPSDSSNKKTSG